jgi:competence protein ComEA
MQSKLLLITAILACLFTTLVWAESVNVNKASAERIAQSIKGIGLKKAQAIVAYRKKHGSFKKLEDLVMVKGIGKKTLEKNKQAIRLKGGKTR